MLGRGDVLTVGSVKGYHKRCCQLHQHGPSPVLLKLWFQHQEYRHIVRNANTQVSPRPTESETLGLWWGRLRNSNLFLTSLLGGSDAGSSLRTTLE